MHVKSQNLPLTALLADSTWEMRRDLAPGLSPVLLYTVHQDTILLFSPWTLDHLRIQHLLPSVQTLNIRTIFELFCDFLPVFGLKADKT